MTRALTGRLLPAVALATALAGLTACGGSSAKTAAPTLSTSASPTASPTPTVAPLSDVLQGSSGDILTAARANLLKAGSVHVVGKETGAALDLRVNGKGSMGYVSYQGYRFDIITVGKAVYYRAPAAFYRKHAGGAKAATLLGNRYLKVSRSMQGVAEFTALTTLKGIVTNTLTPDGVLNKEKVTTKDGLSVLPLVDQGSTGGTLFVTTADPVLPVLLTPDKGTDTIRFSEYGKSFTIAAPKDAIDLATLKG